MGTKHFSCKQSKRIRELVIHIITYRPNISESLTCCVSKSVYPIGLFLPLLNQKASRILKYNNRKLILLLYISSITSCQTHLPLAIYCNCFHVFPTPLISVSNILSCVFSGLPRFLLLYGFQKDNFLITKLTNFLNCVVYSVPSISTTLDFLEFISMSFTLESFSYTISVFFVPTLVNTCL